MKYLFIGDIHGRSNWIKAITGYDNETNTGFKDNLKDGNIDKVVFLGDYTDPYSHFEGISYEDSIEQLNEIIGYKKMYGDKIVLLLGNHDTHYIIPRYSTPCSRYSREHAEDYKHIFWDNLDLFDFALQIGDKETGNIIVTHAGIHEDWYTKRYLELHNHHGTSLGESLNESFKVLLENKPKKLSEYSKPEDCLFDIGRSRGGYNLVGGPCWVHSTELLYHPLPGWHQIVGHNKVRDVKTYDRYVHGDYPEDTTITMVDCLGDIDNYYLLEV